MLSLSFVLYAVSQTILIDGTISGNGAGYHGGRPSSKSGGGGFQGDSYRGLCSNRGN